jgi:hypothetical protein
MFIDIADRYYRPHLLPLTDDKLGSGSIGSFMAGVAQLKSRESA